MPEVKRTLVKSGPELWAEVADPAGLARHLGPFGLVRIAHAEPEHLLRWEGDRARGTVRLEPSGFGTRVILTADPVTPEPPPPPAPVEPPPPAHAPVEPPSEPAEPAAREVPAPRRGFWARLFGRRRRMRLAVADPEPVAAAEPEREPEPVAEPEPGPEPLAVAEPEPAISDEAIAAVLTDTLDALGTAHHRPFSRV
jgi:hypothetical protein